MPQIPTSLQPVETKEIHLFQMLQKLWQLMTSVLNGQVSFGNGTNPDNIAGVWISVTSPVVANTDFTVTHNLNRIPVGYLTMEVDRVNVVYTGSVAATKTQITLRASVASAVLKLFIL